MTRRVGSGALVLLLLLATTRPSMTQKPPIGGAAETGREAWLRYAAIDAAAARQYRDALPPAVAAVGGDLVVRTAQQETLRGLRGLLSAIGFQPAAADGVPFGGGVVLGTIPALRQAAPALAPEGALGPEAYRLRGVRVGNARYLVVAGGGERGVLYGAFALLRKIALRESLTDLDETQAPYAPVRWVNQWDNVNGTIERGYGGASIFWDAGPASATDTAAPGVRWSRADLTRVGEYGRLLASLGLNGLSINNVNANPQLLEAARIPDIARIADALRPWGVRVALSIDFGSPQSVGGLATYDPLDPAVIAWWKDRADALFAAVPDFAGFVLKADSEGRVGPSTYGRTHADAANVVARALKPHGGLIFYRGFVYDHHMDWQNPKNDRGRAAYDNFHPLDGAFDDNVVVQIKNGPIDFQVREPASPLFGGLEKTNQAIELQVTQEYMGQSRHTVFLVPMWKTTLDFDMGAAASGPAPVKAIVAGRTFQRPTGGFVGVVNVGLDGNWVGNHLSQANLYGYGRLAWNPDLSASRIVDEWTRLTFGDDPAVLRTIADIQLTSWRTYENYTGPLGLQTLTDITGDHYGVNVEASERNGWGQWHRADDKGVGMDRSVATGTGFVGQYRPSVARMYETVDATPDDLLLFMHHVPYTQKLHDGRTVIQYLYDAHYDGADTVARYLHEWEALKGKVDDGRYEAIRAQLEYQAGQAIVWRDAVTTWFWKASGIADAKGRVGRYPGRLEAEAAELTDYTVRSITPAEDASGGRAVECRASSCTARFTFAGAAGPHDIAVQYFDTLNGAARFRLRVGGRVVADWAADDRRPPSPRNRLDSSSSTRKTLRGVPLGPGDQIEVEGTPDAMETAAFDYIEVR